MDAYPKGIYRGYKTTEWEFRSIAPAPVSPAQTAPWPMPSGLWSHCPRGMKQSRFKSAPQQYDRPESARVTPPLKKPDF